MFNGQKVVVVMPAYNAEKTLKKTYDEVMAQGIVDAVIIVDDASRDRTVDIGKRLFNVVVHRYEKNFGCYGSNQKLC